MPEVHRMLRQVAWAKNMAWTEPESEPGQQREIQSLAMEMEMVSEMERSE